MNRKRLKELLAEFRCEGCDGLSAKGLGELRDLLVAYQAELEDSAEEQNIPKIAQLQVIADEVSAQIDAVKAEFAAKVAEAKGVKTEVDETEVVETAVATTDEEVDLAQYQTERPAEVAEDGAHQVQGKVMIYMGTDAKTEKPIFGGVIKDSLDLTKALQLAVSRYSGGIGVDGRIDVIRGTYDTTDSVFINSGDPAEATAAMLRAVEKFEDRQNKLALTASGGFCAPVTPDLSFCDMSDTSLDLFQASLPRVRTIRGRVQYMQTPTNDQFYDQWGGIDSNTFAGVGTYFDETASLAVDPGDSETWKGLVQVDCPEQQDPAELAAHYTNIFYKHFTWKAYPEYVDLFIRKALQAHNLKESLALYSQVAAVAEAVPGVSAEPNSVSGFFSALDVQAAAYRDAFWLQRNQVLDIVQPRWVLNVLRAAIARRSDDEVAALQTADATLNRLYASIGLRVNFVSGLNRLSVSTDGASNQVSPIVPTAGVNVWPDAIATLMWVPGSVVLLDNPDWNIGIERLRDTTLQRQNAYSVFAETFSGLAYPCPYPVQSFDVAFCPVGELPPRADTTCTEVSAPVAAS